MHIHPNAPHTFRVRIHFKERFSMNSPLYLIKLTEYYLCLKVIFYRLQFVLFQIINAVEFIIDIEGRNLFIIIIAATRNETNTKKTALQF